MKLVRHRTQFKKRKQSQGVINDWICVLSNVKSSHQEALLYVLEDNEAVIKMIIKGRSPTNETCFQNPQSRAALDWSLDRIILDPNNPNQVHRHQKTQLAYILTKGNFT